MDKLVELAKADMTLFEKIQLYIEELLENLRVAYAGLEPDSKEGRLVSKWTDCIDELHSLWEDAAIAAIGNSQKGSIKTKNTTDEGSVKMQAREIDANGNAYWQIESNKDIFKNIKSTKGLKNAAYNYILRGDKGNKIVGLIDGQDLEFIRVSANEYVYGKQSQLLSQEEFKQKMRMSTSIIDLIENAAISYEAPDHKNHKLFPNGFKNYQGRVGIDNTIFRYIVRVGKAKNGTIFYDINLEVDGEVPRANRTSLLKKSTSDNSLRNFNEKVKENSDKNSDRDTEYLTAVNNNDMETAQKLVDEAARKAGYNSPLLYHGTNSFGFTEFDLDKMDDKRSIFLTSDEEIASTYSGVTGARSVSDIYKKDMSKMSAADLVKELNAYEQKHKNNTADEFHKYELYNFEKLNKLISKVNDGIDDLAKLVDEKIAYYADKLATDFDENDYKVHTQLVALSKGLKSHDYNNLSTPIYMLLHHTEAFDRSAEIAELEKNIRLMNNLRTADMENGAIVDEYLNGYWIDVLSVDDARQALEAKIKNGNYSLYAKLGKSLQIDGKGQLWKDLRNWNSAAFVKKENVEIKKENGEFRLYDKTTNAEIKNGALAVNEYTEKMSKANLLDLMLNKANNSISILTENLHTTRDIAWWANRNGYDSVVFYDILDNGGRNININYDKSADIYVIFNPNNAKSADTVTYDDNGQVIPLSERFDSEKKDIRYSDRDRYWYPDMSRSEISMVRRIANRELNTTENYIDKENKWLYTKTGQNTYFALYSAESENEPTVMYACKGDRAEFEHQFLIQYIEKEENNNESIDESARIISGILSFIKDAESRRIVHSRNTMGRVSNNGNVGIHSEDSRNRPSEAFIDCITNIRKKQKENERGLKLSDRDPEVMAAYEKVNAQLAKENKKLSADVEDLKELLKLQKTVTHGKMLKNSDIIVAAKNIMAHSNAKGDVVEFAKIIKDVYGYIANGEDVSWEAIKDVSQAAADWVRKHEVVKRERTEEATEMLKALRGYNIRLDERQKSEVAYRYGSYKNFRSKLWNKIGVSNDGMPLDSQWHEWAELYPGYFDKDVTANDQPLLFCASIESLTKNKILAYIRMKSAICARLLRRTVLLSQNRFAPLTHNHNH